MSQTPNARPPALREAFFTLSMAQDIPDAKLLDDVIRRYPQFKEELTDFAIALAVETLLCHQAVDTAETVLDPSVVSPAVSRAMSRFQNRLHAVSNGTTEIKSKQASVEHTSNPFSSLPRNEFRALAARLNANAVFVGKLRDRQIDPLTMSSGFKKRVANELNETLDLVVAHFAAPQVLATGQFFKADSKPTTGTQQSFEEAVRNSGLSEAQQKFLLEL